MPKYPISAGVPSNVTVGEPKIVELHKKLGGSQALPGSPAGIEAKPSLVRVSFKIPPGKS